MQHPIYGFISFRSMSGSSSNSSTIQIYIRWISEKSPTSKNSCSPTQLQPTSNASISKIYSNEESVPTSKWSAECSILLTFTFYANGDGCVRMVLGLESDELSLVAVVTKHLKVKEGTRERESTTIEEPWTSNSLLYSPLLRILFSN